MTEEQKELHEINQRVEEIGKHSEIWELSNMQSEIFARCIKNLAITLAIIALLLAAVAISVPSIFVWYLNQYGYESISVEAEQDGNGVNIVGGGDITCGTESYNHQDENEGGDFSPPSICSFQAIL